MHKNAHEDDLDRASPMRVRRPSAVVWLSCALSMGVGIFGLVEIVAPADERAAGNSRPSATSASSASAPATAKRDTAIESPLAAIGHAKPDNRAP